MSATPAALLRRLYVAAALLAACAVADARSSVHLTCDNNLRINPPEGGSVEIGKMMAVDTDGSINSAQVKQMERGLETHTANIAVLTEDNVALKADSVALKADNVALKADSAALKADNVALKADSATLKTANTDFATEIARQAAEIATLKKSAGEQKAQTPEDTVDESTGIVTASSAFCAAWGATMEIFTGKPGSCEFPTVWNADVTLEGWMVPLMKYVRIIKGYLVISSQHYLTSMSSILPNLEEVTSYVNIQYCNGLVKDVAGFASLVKVGGYVSVQSNPNLEVLDNQLFPNLAFAGGEVKVESNPKLTNMSNYLPSLENSTGRVYIYANSKLAAMTNVCESLVTAGGVEIQDADGLTALDSTTGFGNLATSTGKIYIYSNAELLSINGVFPALTAVESGIMIDNNGKLHTVGPDRFGASSSPMTMAGKFDVHYNYVLADVTGFQGLVCTAADKCAMHWYGNPELDKTDVCGVWDSMTNVKKSTSTCSFGSGNVPCYGGPSGNMGTAANC